ncbi:MAG: hypothetical protein J5858_08590 [Lentisphaeria bacterium]|nr:hypothetical protein [Lentisphaeria bacterium]
MMHRFCKYLLPEILCVILLSGTPGCGDNPPSREKTGEKDSVSPAPSKKHLPAKKVFPDTEEGSLKVRFPNRENRKPEVEVKSGPLNVAVLTPDDPAAAPSREKVSRKEQALRKSFRTERPANSFASKLEPLNSGKIIRWMPHHGEDFSGVRLPAVAISPDKSIIVIAETLGENQGPFGSRLIFLDTHSWTITAVHHLRQKNICRIALSPDHIPVLVSRGQEAFRSSDEIILLDPWSGQIRQSLSLPGVRNIFINSRNRLFAVFDPESSRARSVAVFDSLLKNGDAESKELQSANLSPIVAFSPDNSRFYLAGDQTLEIFKDSDLRKEAGIPLPRGFITASLLALPDHTVIAAPASHLQLPAIAVRNGKVQEFGEKSRGLLFPLPGRKDQLFGAVMNRKGRISQFALSTLEEQSGVNPEESRPRTIGDPMAVFAFARIPALAVLDENGCFYLLYQEPSGKRWHKEMLFTSTKAVK